MAAAVAGGLLALAGDAALAAAAAPLADSGVLRVAAADPPDPTTASTALRAAVLPVPLAPEVVDATALVKAVETAAEEVRLEEAARAAEEARAGEEARHADDPSGAPRAAGGGVQMMTGRITSGYGPRWDAQHKGLDIAAPVGSPIRVPLDGVVIDSGPASGFGLWVRVRHGNGTVTLYGHIDRAMVEVGQQVTAGDVIAEVGNRGQSTGPHLHFEVIAAGAGNINPTPWLEDRGVKVT